MNEQTTEMVTEWIEGIASMRTLRNEAEGVLVDTQRALDSIKAEVEARKTDEQKEVRRLTEWFSDFLVPNANEWELAGEKRVEAVKAYRARTGVGLRQAVRAIDMARGTFVPAHLR
jgi:ribosomal protein L7/L12